MSQYKHYSTIFSTKTTKATLISFGLACSVLVVSSILLLLYNHAKTHLPWQTTINGINLNNLTPAEAQMVLDAKLQTPEAKQLSLQVDTISVASSAAQFNFQYDTETALRKLVSPPTETHVRWQVYAVLKRYFTPQNMIIPLSYDSSKLDLFIQALKSKVDTQATIPSFTLKQSGVLSSLQIEGGKLGREVPLEQTRAKLLAELNQGTSQVQAPVASVGGQLTDEEAKVSLEWAKKFVGKSIKLTREGPALSLNDQTILKLLLPPHKVADAALEAQIKTWATTVEQPAQNPVLEYNPSTLEVKTFKPPQTGLTLKKDETRQVVTDLIAEIAANTDAKKVSFEKPLPIATQPPQKPLASTNNLGIDERIGFGESYYAHSIPNRIHNVALTASRITNTIVKAGAEFSFNKTLGDVSAETGFKSAYVIKDGQTILGDGGGVCQVSTTLFRAVLNAGLPVTRRIAHSYRVSYYELNSKPGIDATVYAGNTDFRFINDTGHDILIHAVTDSKNLYMYVDIYGTSDGRTTQIVDHKTWNPRPAPPTVYIPTPTLPPGKLAQVDWAAAGIDASFANVVKDRTGAIIRQDTYVSHYLPWSAKYLQGI